MFVYPTAFKVAHKNSVLYNNGTRCINIIVVSCVKIQMADLTAKFFFFCYIMISGKHAIKEKLQSLRGDREK